MIRKIIKIDEDLCNGCGICVDACHEGAIGMVNGKAKLLRDDYCDGLGDCLPTCPTGAISFEVREALPFNEAEVLKNKQRFDEQKGVKSGEDTPAHKQGAGHAKDDNDNDGGKAPLPCGCPGSSARVFERGRNVVNTSLETSNNAPQESQLRQWPVQIKLVPVKAPYFDGAKLLIAADCTAYAYANFHSEFMKNKITLIGCPKLDEGDYAEKLSEIIRHNNIRSVTVARMEVPCCGGLERAVQQAIIMSGKMLPWQVVVISTDGHILDI